MPPISVPQPKTYGPLGNLPHLNFDEPTQSLVKLAGEYGPIFRMDYPGRSELYISSEKYVAEVTDESKFDKECGLRSLKYVLCRGRTLYQLDGRT